MVEKQFIFLVNLANLILWVKKRGFVLTGGELLRTADQQELYVKSGKSKINNSRHLVKLAIDLNLFINGKYIDKACPEYQEIGNYWCALHPLNRWGGDFNKNGDYKDDGWDANHFEMQ